MYKRQQLERTIDTNPASELPEKQFGVRLHDLVLELCRQMAGDEQITWHATMVQSYATTLHGDESWWTLPDDGYAYENVTRHLVGGGECTQLEALLCDCRWSVRRMDIGGWAALNEDFARLVSSSDAQHSAMGNLRELLSRSWHVVSENRSLFAFNVFAQLSPRERLAPCVAPYLASVHKYFPMRWLHPLTKCVGPKDRHEISRWDFKSEVKSVCVSWPKQRMYIASGTEIHVWSIESQKQLFVIEGHTGPVYTVAISGDGQVIVSGSADNTVRRWDAHTGQPLGDPMEGHTDCVNTVAISGDGQVIVSGSYDNAVRRWDAHTGQPLGDPMEGEKAQQLLRSLEGAGGEQMDAERGVFDVLPNGTSVHSSVYESRRIVLGLHNGCVVVCEVQGPE